MPTTYMREPQSDERHWLELALYELDAAVRAAGKRALLYCGACGAVIPYGHVVTGPIQYWPYCPVHQKPLMVRADPFNGQVCHETWGACSQN